MNFYRYRIQKQCFRPYSKFRHNEAETIFRVSNIMQLAELIANSSFINQLHIWSMPSWLVSFRHNEAETILRVSNIMQLTELIANSSFINQLHMLSMPSWLVSFMHIEAETIFRVGKIMQLAISLGNTVRTEILFLDVIAIKIHSYLFFMF